jgi:tetraacyldisaccharide-1-P 4'-kinase
VADGVNVPYDVYTIDTDISRNGAVIEAGWFVDRRDKLTRRKRWQQEDEETVYQRNDLDKKVVNPSQIRKLDDFKAEQIIYAMAGIGNSERFFRQLEIAGINIERLDFPDHHKYSEDDLNIAGDAPLLMTEKDAVKCRRFAQPNHWYVQVDAQLHDTFIVRINKLMKDMIDG